MFNGESRIADKFVVRLPDGVREQVAAIARTNHRSMNSEIVLALEKLIDDATHVPNSGPLAQSAEEIRALEAFRRLTGDKRKALLNLLAVEK
jgi:hypothetical protein